MRSQRGRDFKVKVDIGELKFKVDSFLLMIASIKCQWHIKDSELK
jgi:hypothetical protein